MNSLSTALRYPIKTFNDVKTITVEVECYGGKRTEIEVADLRQYGSPAIAFHARTAPYPPLLLGTALYSIYIVNPHHRHIISQHPRYIDQNLARIFMAVPPSVSMFIGTKVMGCDGPVYSCIDYVNPPIIIYGEPISVDMLVYRLLKQLAKVPRLRYLEMLARMKPLSAVAVLGALRPLTRRVKLHSIYPSLARCLKHAKRSLSTC